MKRVLKSSLSLFLAFTVIFGSAAVGLSEVDFSGLFTVKAKAANSGTCGENVTWTYADGTVTISGVGEMTEKPSWYGDPYYGTEKVVIEDGVTGLCDYAFSKLSNLSSVSIPASVTKIGINAFNECRNLTSVYITDLVAWCDIDFANDKSNPLFYADALYLNGELLEGEVVIPSGVSVIPMYTFGCHNITSVIIPYGVTEIGDFAFNYSKNLTSVTIPDSVVTIGISAFASCYNLTEVIIPDSVTTIGKKAFYKCSSLKNITLSKNLTAIDEETFSSCSSLEKITIPGSVKNIGRFAFDYCTSLADITFCEGVESIGYCAFYNCTSLTSVVFPDGMQSIGTFAFESCRNLNSITIPDSVTYLSYSSFHNTAYYHDLKNVDKGCLYINNHLLNVNSQNVGECEIREGTKTIAGDALSYCRKITSIKIPDSVVSIGNSAFSNCTGIETITVPDSVESLGSYAFEGCTNLKSIKLSENIKELDYYTFKDCVALETIVIPDSVTSIADYVFVGCDNLKSIDIPESVNKIARYAFYDSAYYNNADNWENEALYLDNHLLDVKNSIVGHFDIKDGTKIIAEHAFFGCDELSSVSIPDSVITIGKCAFDSCKGLVTVNIPGNVSNIGKYAFGGCINLAAVTLSKGVTNIGEGAFKNCDLLSSITIPESVTNIENCALGYDIGTDKFNDFVVCGKPGTIAETYANKNGFLFVDANHTHISTEWKTIKNPTVDTFGVKIKECSVCKNALETEVITQLTPAAPKVSISTSTNSVLLEWKKVTGADEYIVYRREYDPKAKKWSGWTRIEDGLIETSEDDNHHYYYIESYDVNHYYDYSAKSGVYYIYTIRAANEAGRGPYVSTEKLYFLAAPKITSLEHDCNNITIKWNKVSGTKAYIVYRANKHNYGNGWQKIGTTKGTSYVDKSAKVGEHYKYTVRSYNGSYISWFYDNNEITMLSTPKLKSVSCSKDGATVKWNAVKGADSYYVYRREYDAKTKKWGGWTRINSYTQSTSYVDKTAKSGKYYIYTVKARAGAWTHDDYSGYDKTGLKIYFLATPSLKSATSTKSGVKLQWNKISGASGYKIYRKTGNNPWGEAIATVKGNSVVTYVDKTAKKGVTYTYTVRAYNGTTKSGYIPEGKTVKDKY